MQEDFYPIAVAVLALSLVVLTPLAFLLGQKVGRNRGQTEPSRSRILPRFGSSYPSEPALDGLVAGFAPTVTPRPTWLRAAMDSGASVRCVHATTGELVHAGMVLGYRDHASVLVGDGSGRAWTWPLHATEPDPEGGDYDVTSTLQARRAWRKIEDAAQQVVQLRQRGAVSIGYRTALGTDHTLKSIHEALCAAEHAPLTGGQRAVLADLLAEVDSQRPRAADGKHANRGLCTPWCQCENPSLNPEETM
jgi:hypothetical protein